MANLLCEERCSTKFKFDKIGVIEFIGVSRAASGTAIAIPQLKIQLDAGMNVYNYHPESVFVTHCHADHTFRLTHFVSRTKPPKFFMPISITDLIESYLFSSQQLSNGAVMSPNDYDSNHQTIGITGGQTISDFSKNKDLCAHVIDCYHGHVQSVGYAFYLKHKKLCSHLQGVDKSVISKMAKNGEVVTEECELPLFIFLGDTTPEVFESSNPNSAFSFLQNGWKLIFVECTFLSDDELDNAIRTGHTHWKQLKPVVQSFPEVTFVLMHFSRRYRKCDVEEFFANELNRSAAEDGGGRISNLRLFISAEEKLSTGETIEEITDFVYHSHPIETCTEGRIDVSDTPPMKG
jgi:ribonuclease Z